MLDLAGRASCDPTEYYNSILSSSVPRSSGNPLRLGDSLYSHSPAALRARQQMSLKEQVVDEELKVRDVNVSRTVDIRLL